MVWLFWFYDPVTMLALTLAYIAGFLVLQLLAIKVAPRVAASLSGRLSLYTAMLLTALLILGGGVLASYGLYYAAASAGYPLPLGWLVAFILAANLLSYLAAPYMINMAYGARPSLELQEIVDEAAARAGMKPPKAVLVEGPPNAFAYGNFLSGRYVAVTRSLYEMLPRDELLAVVGHELGHHRHRDTVVIMLLGLVPSILYYLGVWLIRAGLWAGAAGGRDREEGGSGLYLALLGVLGVALSFVMQVAVLAFSRLREYYADSHGASVAGVRPMQRALARLHLYYRGGGAREMVEKSSLKALFIYALLDAAASPFYSGWAGGLAGDIDEVVESLKREPVNPAEEVLSDHPPVPKRLRFLDSLAAAAR
ncbi:protease [Pyrodictium occultum]|uniref:Protease HtpX homolog n=1 Tax=Pyrodictium occultum TaxID=2309 RepID=A0A0V8RVV3_PYROC|nr:zinc metalloprotease HtpX [Pyrodictium occultum]KSW12190.1 protease [Pyrodictium occultum]